MFKFKKNTDAPALYDLGCMPTTFDFAPWAVIAKTSGAKRVHFIVDGPIATQKYDATTAWKRFGNICVPICALAGMPFTVGKRIEGREFGRNLGDIQQLYRETGHLEKLQPTQRATETGYVTLTIRQSFRTRYRNSNVTAWQRFAAHLGQLGKRVLVLDECEQAPLDVQYRMALYCGADQNIGVSNGPMGLCHYSDAPYITLNMAPPKPTGDPSYDVGALMAATGFPAGSQYAFRNPKTQVLVWKTDSFENILEAYEAMR